jgi:hypothetical protein
MEQNVSVGDDDRMDVGGAFGVFLPPNGADVEGSLTMRAAARFAVKESGLGVHWVPVSWMSQVATLNRTGWFMFSGLGLSYDVFSRDYDPRVDPTNSPTIPSRTSEGD